MNYVNSKYFEIFIAFTIGLLTISLPAGFVVLCIIWPKILGVLLSIAMLYLCVSLTCDLGCFVLDKINEKF